MKHLSQKLASILSVGLLIQLPLAYAETFTVNSTVDTIDAIPGDGVCEDASGNCTLRAAVMETNALAGKDTINLPAETYTISIPPVDPGNPDVDSRGDLDIVDDLILNGGGATETVLKGVGIDRVIDVVAAFSISNLTITNSSAGGSGIVSGTHLIGNNIRVTGNEGPGISAGGILELFNSTISYNGSGIFFRRGGGGVIVNSTISGNDGAIGMEYGEESVTLISSTVANNGAGIDGIEYTDSSILWSRNSILANNGFNCGGGAYISLGHNISSDSTCGFAEPKDLNNTNPVLGPLADNGGSTETHALLAGSPAIDAGETVCTDAIGAPLMTDQRGEVRPVDGNSDGVNACDIGAFEVQVGLRNVVIDIKPGNKQNTINPRENGGVWVAILSDTDAASAFDPSSQVKIKAVAFGPDGAKVIRHKVKDANRDGLGDLLLRFNIPETGLACGDTKATLAAQTYEGQAITGTDSIRSVGCNAKNERNNTHYENRAHDKTHEKERRGRKDKKDKKK